MKKKPPYLRLLEKYKVAKSTNCWEWTGTFANSGYGQLKVFGRMVSAHRYSYELHNGHIPDGMCVLHQCDNKTCINPDHLTLGTHAENLREAAERGLMPTGEAHPNFGKPRPFEQYRKQCKPVIVKGKKYRSINHAERCLGLGSGTVNYWIKHKPNIAKHIGDFNA